MKEMLKARGSINVKCLNVFVHDLNRNAFKAKFLTDVYIKTKFFKGNECDKAEYELIKIEFAHT